MREKKYYLCFDGLERVIMIKYLNEMRIKLFSEDSYTDAVDDYLLKVINAPTKKIKVICKEKNDGTANNKLLHYLKKCFQSRRKKIKKRL